MPDTNVDIFGKKFFKKSLGATEFYEKMGQKNHSRVNW
jgi:hypothetical protein